MFPLVMKIGGKIEFDLICKDVHKNGKKVSLKWDFHENIVFYLIISYCVFGMSFPWRNDIEHVDVIWKKFLA